MRSTNQRLPHYLLFATAFTLAIQLLSFAHTSTFLKELQPSESSVSLEEGDIFVPGHLPWNRTYSFQQCYVDPDRYRLHFNSRNLRLMAEKYGVAYYMVAKAGSSTARFVMENHFQATSTYQRPPSNATDFTFVREPTSRFVSAYQESLKRILSESASQRPLDGPLEFLKQLSHRNYTIFRKMIETEEGRLQNKRLFESFLDGYDGSAPIEGHLRLQLPRLTNPTTGRTFPMDELIDTANITQYFEHLAEDWNLPPVPEMQANYRGNGQLDPLPAAALRKICQLSALDYCCLNYPLPLECEGAVSCRIINRHNELLIEPISPYPPIQQVD